MLVASVLTSFYMFRALFKVFFGPESKIAQEKEIHESPKIMTVPLMILSVSVLILGFTEGPAAALLGVTQHVAFELPIIGTAMLALVIGFVPSYMTYYLNRPDPRAFLKQHSELEGLRNIMLAGYGFDAAYLAIFVKPVVSIANVTRRRQTGVLGKNLWPILAVLFLLVLWIVLSFR